MDVNAILTSVTNITTATTASATLISAKTQAVIDAQTKKNNDYDKILNALTTGAGKVSEDEAKRTMACYGIAKVDITPEFEARVEEEVTNQLNAEAEANFNKNLDKVLAVSERIAEIEARTAAAKPASPFDQYMQYKMSQEFGTAPQVPQQVPVQTSFDYRKIELDNAAKERDAKIAEAQRLKKEGCLNMVEAAQVISAAKGEYSTKVKALYK